MNAGPPSPPMTLDELKALHPKLKAETLEPFDGEPGLFCRYGAWRFPADSPDAAHAAIEIREQIR